MPIWSHILNTLFLNKCPYFKTFLSPLYSCSARSGKINLPLVVMIKTTNQPNKGGKKANTKNLSQKNPNSTNQPKKNPIKLLTVTGVPHATVTELHSLTGIKQNVLSATSF